MGKRNLAPGDICVVDKSTLNDNELEASKLWVFVKNDVMSSSADAYIAIDVNDTYTCIGLVNLGKNFKASASYMTILSSVTMETIIVWYHSVKKKFKRLNK